jgi:hypothetical protein
VRRLDASEVPATGWLPEAYAVKNAREDAWSGSGPGDPNNPALGQVCVYTLAEAHRFYDLGEATAEASTYRGGALVMQGDVVVWSGVMS